MRVFLTVTAVLLIISGAVWGQNAPVAPSIHMRTMPTLNLSYAISTKASGAQINWLTGQIEAVGIGYGTSGNADAQAQARATAIIVMVHQARRLLPLLPIDADATMGDVAARLGVPADMESIFTGIVTVDEYWEKDTHRYVMVGVLPIYGMTGTGRDNDKGITQLASEVVFKETPAVPALSDMMLLRPIPRGHTPQRFSEPFSGIIIDADNILLSPCLYPRLLRFDGQELWGPETTDYASMLAGPVRYARNVDDAVYSGLAGDHPAILQAIGSVYDRYPILNIDDSYLLLRNDIQHGLLARLPIVITLGQTPEAPLPTSWPAVYAANETASGRE
jgi:hypothetical protein